MLPGSIKNNRRNKSNNIVPLVIGGITITFLLVIFYGYRMTSISNNDSVTKLTTNSMNQNEELVKKQTGSISIRQSPKIQKLIPWNSNSPKIYCTYKNPEEGPLLSIVVLTYQNPELLGRVLDILCNLSMHWEYEIIVADNGCFPSTKALLNRYDIPTTKTQQSRLKYISICTNERYAVANNMAVKKAVSKDSKWLLFLNDDTMPMSGFLHNFQVILETHEILSDNSIGAIGCKLHFPDMKIVEAGSIIRANSETDNFFRDGDRCDPQVRYTRHIHYASGACLFVNSEAFQTSGGFEGDMYKAYFEDTHMQMSILHRQNLSILYSPLSQAIHLEHATFGTSHSKELITESRVLFKSYWEKELLTSHPTESTPRLAHGALSAHLLDREVSASDPSTIRVLLLSDLLGIKQLATYLFGVLSAGKQDNFPHVLLTIVLVPPPAPAVEDVEAYERTLKARSSKEVQDAEIEKAEAWRAIDWLRASGVEILADEFERSGPVYYSDMTENANNKNAQSLIYNKQIRRGPDNCVHSYYEHKSPSLEHILDERAEYYQVVILVAGGQMPSEKRLKTAGVEAVLRIDLMSPILSPKAGRGRGEVGRGRGRGGGEPITVLWSQDLLEPSAATSSDSSTDKKSKKKQKYERFTEMFMSSVLNVPGKNTEKKIRISPRVIDHLLDLSYTLQPVERLSPPSDSVGILTIAAYWSPVLWSALGAVIQAWCQANKVPFVCPPSEYRCQIIDSGYTGNALSLQQWNAANKKATSTTASKSKAPSSSTPYFDAAAAGGFWGVSLLDLPGDQLRQQGMRHTGERPTLLLMPPQHECILKLRSWHSEQSSKYGKANDPATWTLVQLLEDSVVTSRLCQEESLCSTVLGQTCANEDDARKAVDIIRAILSPEAVLLLPLSVFDSAVNSLLAKLTTLTKPGVNFMKRINRHQVEVKDSKIPDEASFNLQIVKDSSQVVADAMVKIQEADDVSKAVSEEEDNPINQAIYKAQSQLEDIVRWDISMHHILREYAMKGQLSSSVATTSHRENGDRDRDVEKEPDYSQ